MNTILKTDGYKVSHHAQYPEGTSLVLVNGTPRSNTHAIKYYTKGVIVFGMKRAFMELQQDFENNFFSRPKKIVIREIKETLDAYLNTDYDTKHFENLHDLGYLPIEVRWLDEGSVCPIRVPMFTIHNTKPEFFWLPNFLETIISCLIWKGFTSATITRNYREVLDPFFIKTTGSTEGTGFQLHDFSMRGMDSIYAVSMSGMGHLLFSEGTDNIPAILDAKKYYGAKGFVAGSVPATEHSVMCAGGKEDEKKTFERLLKLYPTGIVSVVSDTWDLWNVLTVILPELKEEIMSRDGKLVIRPDSGNPADIICGISNKYQDISKYFPEGEILPSYFEDYLLEEVKEETPHGEYGPVEYSQKYIIRGELYQATIHNIGWNRHDKQYYYIDMYEKANITVKKFEISNQDKGVIELLWDVFGGTVNEQGYKVLDPHIGAIYGDSITVERAKQIAERLEAKGFATTNVVFGIGSFTYQFNTRDTYGFAMKATYVEREENFLATPESVEYGIRTVGYPIFKDPITDSGLKKSAKGILRVVEGKNGLELEDEITWKEFYALENKLLVRFKDGLFYNDQTWGQIKDLASKS